MVCGQAYLGPAKRQMFSVTARKGATGQYTFGHEIAHNLGCNHDRGAERACDSPNSNYGWRDPDARWRDMLSYHCRAGDCMNQRAGNCARMLFLANPDRMHNGQHTGKRGVADLAKQINAVRAEVAAYYSPSNPSPAPPTPTPPTPTPASTTSSTPAPTPAPTPLTPAPTPPTPAPTPPTP